MLRGLVIAIVGAESTGKTTLAFALAKVLRAEGRSVAVVAEYLREFCDARGRTPLPAEQAAIAAEQTRRIDAAAARHDVVVADTTALMTAVYSEFVFGDRALYPAADAAHQGVDLVLLTALDLAWQPDGLQRAGPQVRAPADALLRGALSRAGAKVVVVAGQGTQRLVCAEQAVRAALDMRSNGV